MSESTCRTGKGEGCVVSDSRKFEVGQVWQTSRGMLWHVKEVLLTGQAVVRLGGEGRKAFQNSPPPMWRLREDLRNRTL